MEVLGKITDSLPLNSPSGSWRKAKNIVLTKNRQSIANEDGFQLCSIVNGNLIGKITLPEGAVIFSVDGIYSEIGLFINDTYIPKLRTVTLGFDINFPIEGVYQYNYNQELIIGWTDFNKTIKILNLTNLPFALTPALELVNPSQITLAELNPLFSMPKFDLVQENNGGGVLPEGSIYLALAYYINDNDLTNISILSNPIPVFKSSTRDYTNAPRVYKVSYPDFDHPSHPSHRFPTYYNPQAGVSYNGSDVYSTGNNEYPANSYLDSNYINTFNPSMVAENVNYDSGTSDYGSSTLPKSFNIRISNLDTNYSKFILYTIVKTKDGTTAYKYSDFTIGSSTFDFLLSSVGIEQVVLDDILIPKSTDVLTCKTMTSFEKRLYLGNIKSRPILDFQKYANNIKVNWIDNNLTNDVANGNIDDHYYNSALLCFDSRTFTPFEVYGFNIHFVYKDGTVTEGYHIPGREANSGDKDVFSTISDASDCELEIADSNTKRFHLRDTSTRVGNFQLGYWENKDELYPNLPTSEIWDSTGQIGTLSGTNVRHHRMPTHRTLYNSTTIGAVMNKTILLKFSNIYIPTDIANQVQGFFISYNKRTIENSLILGESLTLNKNSLTDEIASYQRNDDDLRFYDYDLIRKKPAISPTYIKIVSNQTFALSMEDRLDSTTTSYALLPEDKDSCLKILLNHYADIDNYSIPDLTTDIGYGNNQPGNATCTECIMIKISKVNNTSIQYTGLRNYAVNFPLTCQLVQNLYNVYGPYGEQSTVRLSEMIPINGSNTYDTSNISNGDTYLTRQLFLEVGGFRFNNPYKTENKQGLYTWLRVSTVYSKTNYGFICCPTPALDYSSAYNYPYQFIKSIATIDTPYLIEEKVQQTLGGTPQSPIQKYMVQVINYNEALNSINDIIDDGTFNPIKKDVRINPFIIRKSIIQQSESLVIGWRSFLANDYYEMNRDKGEIWKLSSYQRMLLIHQKFSLYYAPIKDIMTAPSSGNTTEIYLGTGDIFDRPPFEAITTDEGVCGCQSQFATFVCEYGYFSIDLQKGQVFLFNGKLNRLSDKGLMNELREVIQTAPTDVDNPYLNKGFSAGYDYQNKRILFTLNNKNDDGKITYFTYSYSCEYEFWVSLHDYNPCAYIFNRKGLYSLSTLNNGIYKNNVPGIKGIYYTSDIYPFEIDILYNTKVNGKQVISNSTIDKTLYCLFWQTLVQDLQGNTYFKDTITSVCVYTNSQSTGIINVKEKNPIWFNGNGRELDEGWYYNDLRDVVKDRNIFIHDNRGNINLNNISTSLPWFKKSKIISKFMIVKLSYDNVSQRDIYLSNIQFLDRIISDRI